MDCSETCFFGDLGKGDIFGGGCSTAAVMVVVVWEEVYTVAYRDLETTCCGFGGGDFFFVGKEEDLCFGEVGGGIAEDFGDEFGAYACGVTEGDGDSGTSRGDGGGFAEGAHGIMFIQAGKVCVCSSEV